MDGTEKRSMSWWPVIAGGAFLAAVVVGGSALSRGQRKRVPQHSEAELVIARPAPELYRYWRCFDNLPHFIATVDAVAEIGGRAQWLASGLEWETEIVDELEPSFLRWRSVPDSTVFSEGEVEFTPVNDGTLVRLSLGGAGLGDASDHLHRFRRLMEA